VRGVRRLTAAFRAWRSYRGAGFRTRAFLAARLAVLPLGALGDEFERLHGRVLALGSGHGLLERWLAELNPDVVVEGSDLDAERVALASRTQANAPRLTIRRLDVRELDEPEGYDAALAVDVLHHVPYADHEEIARALARAVRPGGVVLIKEIARTPQRKHSFNAFHDHVVAGEHETFAREPEDLAALLERAGFATERCERVAPLSPYPHFILRLRRAPAGS
jgi:2-polyprenyl-3-methyl-5-hydroxy-6-metoxy-1,4-benzoquinol methylase